MASLNGEHICSINYPHRLSQLRFFHLGSLHCSIAKPVDLRSLATFGVFFIGVAEVTEDWGSVRGGSASKHGRMT